MRHNRIIAFILSMMTALSVLPKDILAENTPIYKQNERGVYIHTFEGKDLPKVSETPNKATVYMGDTVNLYFSVDDPNKGEYLAANEPSVDAAANAEAAAAALRADSLGLTGSDKDDYVAFEKNKARELARHTQPQFDMQGYTVTLYFNTKYFKPKNLSKEKVVDFTIPNNDSSFTSPDGGDITDSPENVVKPGYLNFYTDIHYDTNEEWGYVRKTIFLMESGFLPQRDEAYWYNLCSLPLEPIQPGYTYFRLEYGSNDDLELFAKNNKPEDKLNFTPIVENDGYFYVTIGEKGKPNPPYPDKPAGTYNRKIEISLEHTNNDECIIYYTLSGQDPREAESERYIYPQTPIEFDINTTIRTAAYRTKDQKWSDVRDYEYKFVPHSPYLFNSRGEVIPNIYNETYTPQGYYVTAADTQTNGSITAGCTIFYTYDAFLSVNELSVTNPSEDASTGWKKAVNGNIDEAVTGDRTIRLVAVNQWGKSDVSEYFLGVKPDAVTATPDSGIDREQPIKLYCGTPNSKIYYTLNGQDPRMSDKILYNALDGITVTEDSVIKAVAYYNGKWGDVSSYWYLFSDINRSGVYAFNPSGTYRGSVDVTLYPYKEGEKILISYDNGITFNPYDSKTMNINKYTEFRAKTEGTQGVGDKFVYIIRPNDPIFSPESSQFINTGKVTIFAPDATGSDADDYELWYTTDGSEPTAEDKAPSTSVDIQITEGVVIKAVVVKDGKYMSDVVDKKYSIVYNKPASPLTTLLPDFYTREIGSKEFTTLFKEVPTGTEIYYTLGTGEDAYVADPDILNVGNGTYKYENKPIEVIDTMKIKAIAVRTVNGAKVSSDVAQFFYRISPRAPETAPSAVVNELPVIHVDAVAVKHNGDRSIINYTVESKSGDSFTDSFVNDFENDSELEQTTRFYIDTKTGIAYRKYENGICSQPLVDESKAKSFNDTVVVRISNVLDGVDSGEKAYMYMLDNTDRHIMAPYADKESGTYEEGKNAFEVNLYSVYADNSNIKIQWKYSQDSAWKDYENEKPVFETKDTILYIRNIDKTNSDNVSNTVGYVYYFIPPAPIITPVSGTYPKENNTGISIKLPENLPQGGEYRLYYAENTESYNKGAVNKDFDFYVVDGTKNIRAYLENINTKKISSVSYASYIALEDSKLGSAVSIEYPFSKKRISAHRLAKGDYAKGIIFDPLTGVNYSYTYTPTTEAGGEAYESAPNIVFDKNNTLIPTERMDSLSVSFWIDGNKTDTIQTHDIDFIHLGKPVTTLELPENKKEEYTENQEYKLINEYYSSDKNIILYYTTDGKTPDSKTSLTRKAVKFGEEYGKPEKLTHTSTTVKAVYYSACGESDCEYCKYNDIENCPDGEYGEVAEYKYMIPSKTTVTVGGGGGGGSSRNIKYTKDIFGNEHSTHIGYINGYPDGSVRPDGDITREEIAAILYRITNHEYEKPFFATGEFFPDVEKERWSAHDIEYMADKEIVYGYPDGEFKPSRNLSRAEFAALIFRFAGVKSADAKNPFTDLEETHWAYQEIRALSKIGLIEGYEDNTFGPENNITRAEVMTVINKLLGRKPLESYVKSLKFNPYNDLYEDKWYYVTVLEATITHNYLLNGTGYEYKWEDWK